MLTDGIIRLQETSYLSIPSFDLVGWFWCGSCIGVEFKLFAEFTVHNTVATMFKLLKFRILIFCGTNY